MGSCGSHEANKDAFKKIGLIPGYSYSILSAIEVSYQGKKEKLVELRNPWGSNGEEWRGKWSDQWVGWNEDLLVKTGKKNWEKNSGRFLMEFADFRNVFGMVSFCKVHENYFYFATPVRQNKNAYSIRSMKITEKTACYIGNNKYLLIIIFQAKKNNKLPFRNLYIIIIIFL